MSTWSCVKGLQEWSMCDWPGHITASLFLGGCNFRCPTCHNWNLATAPHKIETESRESVLSYLSTQKLWLDGVVVTGGEPTVHSGLGEFLTELVDLGLKVNLHTNGFRPEVIRELLELVEIFSVDIKGPWVKYPALTAKDTSPEEIQDKFDQVFDLAVQFPEKFYFRTTLVPDLTDEDVVVCRSYLPEGYELHLQEYRVPSHLK